MFSSELLHLRFLGPLTSHLQILNDDGDGVLNTSLTREWEPDRIRGKADFVKVLDLDP